MENRKINLWMVIATLALVVVTGIGVGYGMGRYHLTNFAAAKEIADEVKAFAEDDTLSVLLKEIKDASKALSSNLGLMPQLDKLTEDNTKLAADLAKENDKNSKLAVKVEELQKKADKYDTAINSLYSSYLTFPMDDDDKDVQNLFGFDVTIVIDYIFSDTVSVKINGEKKNMEKGDKTPFNVQGKNYMLMLDDIDYNSNREIPSHATFTYYNVQVNIGDEGTTK